MPTGIVRVRGPALFVLLAAMSFFGAAVPLACSRGSRLAPAEAGATGGANGGTAGDAAATGGAGAQVSDASGPDVLGDSSMGDSEAAGGRATDRGGNGGGGGTSAAGGEGGLAGGPMMDAGSPDVAQADGAGTDRGGAGDVAPSDGAAGGDGGATDGGAADAMFSCGPCAINWTCGGATGTPYTYVTLVSEADGCYLSGLPGHKLLAPDGTITDDGVNVARAQSFGPRVGIYYPDGSQWLFCAATLPCTTQ